MREWGITTSVTSSFKMPLRSHSEFSYCAHAINHRSCGFSFLRCGSKCFYVCAHYATWPYLGARQLIHSHFAIVIVWEPNYQSAFYPMHSQNYHFRGIIWVSLGGAFPSSFWIIIFWERWEYLTTPVLLSLTSSIIPYKLLLVYFFFGGNLLLSFFLFLWPSNCFTLY